MRAIAIALLLPLTGCMTMTVPAPNPPQVSAIPTASVANAEQTVRIVPSTDTVGPPPMMVSLRAETVGLVPPLKFHWSLGNGREWEGPQPPTQIYIVGRYDVILTVTDADGKVKRASLTVDAENHGCGI